MTRYEKAVFALLVLSLGLNGWGLYQQHRQAADIADLKFETGRTRSEMPDESRISKIESDVEALKPPVQAFGIAATDPETERRHADERIQAVEAKVEDLDRTQERRFGSVCLLTGGRVCP